MRGREASQSSLDLFACCTNHDDDICGIDLAKQTILVCCKQCVHYHYTFQTFDSFIRERTHIAEMFNKPLKDCCLDALYTPLHERGII